MTVYLDSFMYTYGILWSCINKGACCVWGDGSGVTHLCVYTYSIFRLIFVFGVYTYGIFRLIYVNIWIVQVWLICVYTYGMFRLILYLVCIHTVDLDSFIYTCDSIFRLMNVYIWYLMSLNRQGCILRLRPFFRWDSFVCVYV